MTKYNAILIRKNPAWELKCGLTKYVAKFLIAIKDNTHVVEIEAGQLKRPINAEAGDEIIIDITAKSVNGRTYYNINPFTSYEESPFPLIKQTYKTILDGDGWDEISHKAFKDYPYREVTICRVQEFYGCIKPHRDNMGEVYCTHDVSANIVYEIVEVGDEIDFTEIRNTDLCNKPLWPIKKESDQEHLCEALRDYLPEIEHPLKETYTPTKIFQYYLPAGRGQARNFDPPRQYRYGSHDNRCICGHYIEDVRWVQYASPYPAGIIKDELGAIGNCCIRHFAVSTRLYTRLLSDIVDNYKSGTFSTMRDISRKNGFDDLPMRLLERHILTPDEFKTLEAALSDRTKNPLNNALKCILHHISEFYNKNYNYVFTES